MLDLLSALALVLVIEGALYALFPEAMRRMMRVVLEMPPEPLRIGGAVAVAAGLVLLWAVRG